VLDYFSRTDFARRTRVLDLDGKKGMSIQVGLEFLYNAASMPDVKLYESYLQRLQVLLAAEWGEFPPAFVRSRIANSRLLLLAWDGGELVGFSAMSLKHVCDRLVHYIEFAIVRRQYEPTGVSGKLVYSLLKDAFLSNVRYNRRLSLELAFITANVRTLSNLAKYAGFLYPNPSCCDKQTGRVPKADDLTWAVAQELIKQSDRPGRTLKREGCVLLNSYEAMPWLVDGLVRQSKNSDERLSLFAQRYLDYRRREGREFVVRAVIRPSSLARFALTETLGLPETQ